MLPLCKLEKSVFVFGTQQRWVISDSKGVLKVQVGVDSTKDGNVNANGYISVPDYLSQNALKQCRKIYLSMKARGVSFNEVVVEIVSKLSAPTDTQAFYADKHAMADTNFLFELLCSNFEENLA